MEERTPFVKKLDEIHKKTGFDQNFTTAAYHHLQVLKAAHDKDTFESRDELCNVMLSRMFIDTMDLYPTKRSKCQIDETSDCIPVPPVPSEIFGAEKFLKSDRKDLFFMLLKVGDILDCKVDQIEPKRFILKVIHKYSVTRVVDDLDVEVVLPKTFSELAILKTNLVQSQLIRVAVTQIEQREEEQDPLIHTTINASSIEFERSPPKLGRISEADLPAYVLGDPETEGFESYADYLKSKPNFANPHMMKETLAGFGMDPTAVYSYYQQFDGSQVEKNLTGEELYKDAQLASARNYARLALEEQRRAKLSNALVHIEDSIRVCPKKDPLLCRLYEIRSEMFLDIRRKVQAKQAHPRLEQKILMDLELAHEADNNNLSVNSKMSKYLFMGANSYYRRNEYYKAAKALEQAVVLDPNNTCAFVLLEHIRRRHRDELERLDARSLNDLRETQRDLLNRLREIQNAGPH